MSIHSFWALVGAGILTVFFSILADGYSAHYSKLCLALILRSLPREADQFSQTEETFQRNILSTFIKKQRAEHHARHPLVKIPENLRHRHHHNRSPTSTTAHSPDLDKSEHVQIDEKSSAPSTRNEEKQEVTGREELFSLFSDALRHLDHLATGDASDTHAVDLVVRKVMGKLQSPFIA